ncbi:52 kDa repressor of the inhibitor of the protein kinase-like [Aphis craccivora]|uniref:52 kDa repressor of the inhibitor of the protein kinase-like n=1 Tax=Aphis craccivora TaxID=307492 RepID=A0A6G0W1U2_APHCR|nr:52 kDa repressor of the inhibitor of the protein kinase-like [Aphis craccivora]
MPNYCAVREPHSIGKTVFGVPKDNEIKELWENALGRVCASHFKNADIISSWKSGEGQNKYTVEYFIFSDFVTIICLKTFKFKKGAVPIHLNKHVSPLGLNVKFENPNDTAVPDFIDVLKQLNEEEFSTSKRRKIDVENQTRWR